VRSPFSISFFALAAVTLGFGAVSCGGSSSVGLDGGAANLSSSGGSIDLTYGDPPPDMDACPGYLPMPEAAPPDDASTACIGIAGAVTGGADPCTPRTSLTPSDISSSNCESDFAKVCGGTRYQVICACPEGTCACLGPSTHVVSFGNCPYCPQQDQVVYALCGFPYFPF
jgi:hypothetical protein